MATASRMATLLNPCAPNLCEFRCLTEEQFVTLVSQLRSADESEVAAIRELACPACSVPSPGRPGPLPGPGPVPPQLPEVPPPPPPLPSPGDDDVVGGGLPPVPPVTPSTPSGDVVPVPTPQQPPALEDPPVGSLPPEQSPVQPEKPDLRRIEPSVPPVRAPLTPSEQRKFEDMCASMGADWAPGRQLAIMTLARELSAFLEGSTVPQAQAARDRLAFTGRVVASHGSDRDAQLTTMTCSVWMLFTTAEVRVARDPALDLQAALVADAVTDVIVTPNRIRSIYNLYGALQRMYVRVGARAISPQGLYLDKDRMEGYPCQMNLISDAATAARNNGDFALERFMRERVLQGYAACLQPPPVGAIAIAMWAADDNVFDRRTMQCLQANGLSWYSKQAADYALLTANRALAGPVVDAQIRVEGGAVNGVAGNTMLVADPKWITEAARRDEAIDLTMFDWIGDRSRGSWIIVGANAIASRAPLSTPPVQ